jgi:hypothetical protein
MAVIDRDHRYLGMAPLIKVRPNATKRRNLGFAFDFLLFWLGCFALACALNYVIGWLI